MITRLFTIHKTIGHNGKINYEANLVTSTTKIQGGYVRGPQSKTVIKCSPLDTTSNGWNCIFNTMGLGIFDTL